MRSEPKANFGLSPIAKQRLADFIASEKKKTQSRSLKAFQRHFEAKVAPRLAELQPGATVVLAYTMQKWLDKVPGSIDPGSLLQLAIYKDCSEQEVRTWLDGGDPQGDLLQQVLPVLRTAPVDLQELSEILYVLAERISKMDFSQSEVLPLVVTAPEPESPRLIQIHFDRGWLPALTHAAKLFGDQHTQDPLAFQRNYGVRPSVVTALLEGRDIDLLEAELQSLVEILATDRPGFSAEELLNLFRGDRQEE